MDKSGVVNLHTRLSQKLLLEQREFANAFWDRRAKQESVSDCLSGAQKDIRRAHGGVVEFRAALNRAYADLMISEEEMEAAMESYNADYKEAERFIRAECIKVGTACIGHKFFNQRGIKK